MSAEIRPSLAIPAMPRLPRSVPRSGVSEQARLSLRQLLGDIDRQLADAFNAGRSADELVRARAQAVERVVEHVWIACVGEREKKALFAVGGFGRGELFPFSDVDLLVLAETAGAGRLRRALESFFTCLWDIGLKPGHAVRTLGECRELAAGDATIYTSLLDARLIHGPQALEQAFLQLMDDATLWPPQRFFAAKRSEEEQRRARFNDTAYNLEPNLKDGPGGLRALQLILWLGRRVFAAPTFAALVQGGMISAAEAEQADEARGTLWRIRYALHLIAGRPEERLLFDFQRELATRMGYSDEHAQNLGVEQFMQDYYRAAIAIQRLNDQFVQRCEEALDADIDARTLRLNLDFVSVGGRLDCDPPDLFLRRPAALIDLFRVWIEHLEIKGLRADLSRRINEALLRVGPELADNDDVNAAFARLLRKGAPAVDALVRMNRHGVLAQYLPAFGRVVGRMQYDLFHVYTVDEHTMRVLRNVAKFVAPETSRDYALAHELFARLAQTRTADTRGAVPRHRQGSRWRSFRTRRTRRARILFAHRLVRCGHRPGCVAGALASDHERHRTAPGHLQSRHRASLRCERRRLGAAGLFVSAYRRGYLRHQCEIVEFVEKINFWPIYTRARATCCARVWSVRRTPPSACANARRTGAKICSPRKASMPIRWHASGRISPKKCFLRFRADGIAWQTGVIARAGAAGAPLVQIDAHGPRGGSEVFVYARDGDGLFAAVTAVLERMRLSVQDARIVTLRSGMGMDSFLVLDALGHALDESIVARLEDALREVLAQTPYRAQMSEQRPARRLRHFHVQTRIEFRDDLP